jgi:hypothetical protein
MKISYFETGHYALKPIGLRTELDYWIENLCVSRQEGGIIIRRRFTAGAYVAGVKAISGYPGPRVDFLCPQGFGPPAGRVDR